MSWKRFDRGVLLGLVVLVALSPASAASYLKLSRKAPEIVPEDGKAIVHVLRPARTGTGIRIWAFADEQVLGVTRGTICTVALVPEGTHVFWARAENVSAFEMTVESGDTYYLKQKVQVGAVKARVELVALSDAEAEKTLKKCAGHSTLTEAGIARGGEIVAEKLAVAEQRAAERQE